MIRKVLKVELREAFASMLPVGAGMLVLSALTGSMEENASLNSTLSNLRIMPETPP